MQRIVVTLSDDEFETLRRVSFERRTPVSRLVRDAIDQAHGTSQSEITGPGRKRPEGQA